MLLTLKQIVTKTIRHTSTCTFELEAGASLEGQIDRASMTTSMHSLDYVILTRIIDI